MGYRGRHGRCATLVRLAADPLLENQLQYATYVLGIIAATWLCGFEAGIAAAVLSVFAGHYFFIQPRHHLIPDGPQWFGVTFALGIAAAWVWYVARWTARRDPARSWSPPDDRS